MFTWLLNRLRGDKIIWLTVILICMVSVLAVYSSSSALSYRLKGGDTEAYALRHMVILVLGFVVMFVVHLIDYRVFARMANVLLLVSVGMLIFTLANGSEVNEAARWVSFLGTSFQPSDLAKLTLMVLLAKVLTQRQEVIKDFNEGFLPALMWVGILCGLIAPANLSTASLMFAASVMVMFVAGIDLRYIGILLVVAALGAGVLFGTAKRASTWESRLYDYKERMLNPNYEPEPQITLSYIAVSSGKFWGKGAGKSVQRNFLPQAYADFVYAIIIEEYGLLGGAFVLSLYLLLLMRSVSIVTSSKTFGALLAAGLSFMLVLQALLNMGVTVGLLPITGLTLPFISMGGTSILFSSVALGIILSVSRDVLEKKQQKKSPEAARTRRPAFAFAGAKSSKS